MSDKVQKIRQEIERRINVCEKYSQLNLTESTRIGNHAQLLELRELKDFIDSTSEELNKDLEEYAKKLAKGAALDKHNLIWMCKKGAEWQKQQMMKDAVEGQIYREYIGDDGISIAFGLEAYLNEHNPKHNKLHDGDKVKIVIVKEEHQ